MTDSEFLTWIRDRLVHVYGESPNVDFVLRLGEIVETMNKAEDRKSFMKEFEIRIGRAYDTEFVKETLK